MQGIGQQVGELIRCIVKQEISSHEKKIEQLQALLEGRACAPVISQTTEEEPPAA